MANTCVISKVEYTEDAVKPIIVNFENGTIEPGQEKNVLCKLYKNQNKNREVVAATENMLYTGIVKPKGLYNTFIAVCNKKRTKMRLIAVDHATLSPYFKEDKGTRNKSFELLDSTTSQLNKEFGSKKIKRKTEQRERMKMDIETVKEQLEQTVQDIKIETKDIVLPKADENDTGYKPRINREADAVEDVYNINDIVSIDVLNSFYEETERILSEPEAELDVTSFVKQQIQKLLKTSSENRHLTLQLLLYVDCLIKFLVKQAKQLSAKGLQLCSYSKMAQDYILKQYTITSGRSRLRPTSMKDKCLCSILVLSIIACGYKLNLEMVSKELKIGLKKMQDVSRVLGFHVNKEMVTLSLPLPLPVSRFNVKKKKK